MCDVSTVGRRLSECRDAGADGSRFFQRLRPFKNFNILTGGDRRTAAARTVVVDKFSFGSTVFLIPGLRGPDPGRCAMSQRLAPVCQNVEMRARTGPDSSKGSARSIIPTF